MASPLSVFRKYQYVALVALGVLAIVSFVILPPINDYLMSARQSGGPEGKQVVLTWTNGKVRESELRSMQNAHNLTMNFLEAIARAASEKKGQPKDPYNLARRDPSEQAVVARMILAEKAERLGVVVSDETLEDYIYQISGGVLEPAELNELLRTATGRRLTRQMLFTELRREMLAMTMRQMAFSGLSAAPPAANWLHFNRLRETTVLELVPLPVEDFVGELKKEPTAEELRTLYDKYKSDFRNPNTPEPGFRRPDQINFGYFRLDFERFLAEAKQQITEEQIQAEYEQGLTRGDFRRPQLPPSSPPATPAPPADGESTTPMNGEPATETDPDAPAEPPASEPPATEEPATEEPATEEPATEEPATEEPATEEPATEEPATEEPATEEPATEEPASETSNGGCDTQEPAEPAATEPEEAQETPPATDSASETEPAAPAQPAPPADGETPATDAAAAEAPPSEPAPSEEAAPPTAPETTLPAAPENRTLEEVRDEILLKLARPKAREHREQVKKELQDQLQVYFREYTLWRSQVRTGAKSAQKPTPPDYEQLAERYGVEYESTGLVDPFQAEKTELGQTSRLDFQARAFVPFVQIAFDPEVQLFSPREIDNRETGDIEYVYWKSDHKDAYVPEFKEIRVEVEDTWKRLEARKLAAKKAQQLQKQAASAEGSLKERLPDYAERVQQTNEFSWLTMGNLGSLFSQQPQLSSVEGVDGVTWDFMESVFGLKEGEVGVATNAAETVYYVVRVAERSPSQEVLRERFLREFPLGGMQQTLPLLQEEQRAYYQEWYNQLEEEMKVNWARVPDQMPAERS